MLEYFPYTVDFLRNNTTYDISSGLQIFIKSMSDVMKG